MPTITSVSEESIESLLKDKFKLSGFRPMQKEVILHALAGQSALVLMPTGLGKSLTFQLPCLLMPGVTLVISPLKALMKDQVDSLRAKKNTCKLYQLRFITIGAYKKTRRAQVGAV